MNDESDVLNTARRPHMPFDGLEGDADIADDFKSWLPPKTETD